MSNQSNYFFFSSSSTTTTTSFSPFSKAYGFFKKNRTFWIGSALFYTFTTTCTYFYFQRLKQEQENLTSNEPWLANANGNTSTMPIEKTTAIYNSLAKDYDKRLYWEEWRTGILLLRRWMISKAKGKVLEIAAGTGRNLPYYSNAKVNSLSLVDASSEMLTQLHTKDCSIPFRTYLSTVETLPFDSNSFDTVVSTFTLCSVPNPSLTLMESLRVLKPGGSMYLIEHGESKYDWLNKYMHRAAPIHALKWGCWFDRNIQAILNQLQLLVQQDASMNMKLEFHRFHFGTTWVITITKFPKYERFPSKHKNEVME